MSAEGREIIIERVRRLKGMGVAGTAACHRVRIASPEVLHRFENGKTGLFQAPSPAPAPPAAPPRQWWRWERKLRMGVATLSACQWPRVA
jgi:hypothetical protein